MEVYNRIFMGKNKLIFMFFTIISFISTMVSGMEISASTSIKLVIDTDAGADDAIAISLLLSASVKGLHNFEIVAITCTFGNVEEKYVEQNVLKTLTVNNATHIPVFAGAKRALLEPFKTDSHFGSDGFGNFEFDQEIEGEIDNSTHAAVALVDLASAYNGELQILALGPLTNIALAIGLDPNFMKNIQKLYVMGGCVSGIGSRAPGVEFNFGSDPDSALIVFNELTEDRPAVLVPRETTIDAGIPKDWRRDQLGKINSSLIKFLNKAEGVSLTKGKAWRPADVMTAAYMIYPMLAKKQIITNVTPVNDGAARGVVLVDYAHKTGKINNTEIIQSFDSEEFKRLLYTVFL